MKKLLLAFAILGFVACGGSETVTTPTEDSTALTSGGDSSTVAPVTGGDSTQTGGGDSTKIGGGDSTTTKP